jgi:Spy/CpxP family protein refolding chaperone
LDQGDGSWNPIDFLSYLYFAFFFFNAQVFLFKVIKRMKCLTKSIRKMKNMNMGKWILGIVALMFLLGIEANAQYGRGYGRGPGRGFGNSNGRGDGGGPAVRDRMGAWLDLSEEQETQIEKLHLGLQKEILPVRNMIREKEAQLSTMISDGTNQTKIDQLVEEVGSLRTQIQKLRMNTHLKVRELLTDDQKIKFDNHFANRMGRWGVMTGPHGWHGRGWE